jgi:hypothetical protein
MNFLRKLSQNNVLRTSQFEKTRFKYVKSVRLSQPLKKFKLEFVVLTKPLTQDVISNKTLLK